MSTLSCAIVGLPNVGKSTLFNALTSSAKAEASNYPFCTIDPNVGNIKVPDPRLAVLSKLSKSQKLIYADTQFVDVAGLVKGASKGEGLGNKFLANIREAQAIAQVVRCFEDSDVVHVAGKVNPIHDIEVINLELILSDIQTLENIIPKLEKQAKLNKESKQALDVLIKVKEHLYKEQMARTLELSDEEKEWIKPYPLITQKKMLYVANVSESDLPSMENAHVAAVREYARAHDDEVIAICAKLEEEIAQLPLEEREEYLHSLGLKESGLERLAKASFKMLGLITYLTTGEIETRAWTIKKGIKAPQAAGEIHTDLEKGFVRAQVISYEDFVKCGSRVEARKLGLERAEGKDYVVQDGDVINFLHH